MYITLELLTNGPSEGKCRPVTTYQGLVVDHEGYLMRQISDNSAEVANPGFPLGMIPPNYASVPSGLCTQPQGALAY